MQRKIAWSFNAITLLDDIYDFYKIKSQAIAIKLYSRLLNAADPLKTFPYAGPLEPLLEEYDAGYRSFVVEKHYKLIYTVSKELIEIHAVWDCRQDGWRLKEMFE